MKIAFVEAYKYTVFWLDFSTLLLACLVGLFNSLTYRLSKNLCHPYRHGIAYHFVGIKDIVTRYLK